MAIFRAPRLTTTQRATLTLASSEIVYDTDQKTFYGGDNLTVGGFPIGSGVGKKFQLIEITSQMVIDKQLELTSIPLFPSGISLEFINGTRQLYGVDFTLIPSTKIISWDGLGLDGFIESGDVIYIQY